MQTAESSPWTAWSAKYVIPGYDPESYRFISGCRIKSGMTVGGRYDIVIPGSVPESYCFMPGCRIRSGMTVVFPHDFTLLPFFP